MQWPRRACRPRKEGLTRVKRHLLRSRTNAGCADCPRPVLTAPVLGITQIRLSRGCSGVWRDLAWWDRSEGSSTQPVEQSGKLSWVADHCHMSRIKIDHLDVTPKVFDHSVLCIETQTGVAGQSDVGAG